MKEIVNNILSISIMCSAAVLVILILRKVFGNKSGAWWRTIVWLVLLVRLCLPINISSSIGIINENGLSGIYALNFRTVFQNDTSITYEDNSSSENTSQLDIITHYENNYSAVDKKPVNQLENISPAIEPVDESIKISDFSNKDTSKPRKWQALNTIFLCGFAVSLILLFIKMTALSLSLKKLADCKNENILSIFYKTKKQLGIKRDIKILIGKNINSPALAGVFKPKIIMPEKTTFTLSNEELRYVFMHELTHYKKNDILKLWFAEFVLCLHWFNPILHYAKSIIRQDIELACDEKIISKLNENIFIKYCNILMKSSVKKHNFTPGIITVNMTGKQGNKFKERLVMINNFNRKRISLLGASLLIAASLILVSCSTLSASKVEYNLGITPNEMNENIKYLSQEAELRSFNSDFISKETEYSKWGTTYLTYPLVIDSNGNTVFSLSYTMAGNGIDIKEIILEKETDDYNNTIISYTNTKRVIDISLLMHKYGVSNIGMFDFTNYHYLGSKSALSLELIKAEDGISSYEISPYTQKDIEIINTGLNIAPDQMDEKIRYLMDNNWLDTKLVFAPESSYSVQENGKIVIKHPLVSDDDGNEIITLEYIMAPDGIHIETIMTKNREFFSRDLYQELYIDTNLIAGKAYLLASENKKNLEDQIPDDEKPIYINDLQYTKMNQKDNIFCSTLMDSNINLYAVVVKSSLDSLEPLAPMYSQMKYYTPGLLSNSITPASFMLQISKLINEKYIDTELNFKLQEVQQKKEEVTSSSDINNVTIISVPDFSQYQHVYGTDKITGYNILTNNNDTDVLSIYFIQDTYALFGTEVVDENIFGYIKNIYVVYKSYLGNEDTDKLYKDLCLLTGVVMTQFNDKTLDLPAITVNDYFPLSITDWDMNGTLKISYAPDHETLFASFGDTDNIPIWANLPYYTDERHPNLGITFEELKEKLNWLLQNHPEYNEFVLDTTPIVDEISYENILTTYPIKTTSAGLAYLSYSFTLDNDSELIKSIDIQLRKDRLSDENLIDAEYQYFILRDMIDTALIMAREKISFVEDISSIANLFPQYSNNNYVTVKIFENQAYLTEAQNEIANEQQIITANPLFEIMYFK